jgi:hypothetical protein
MDAERLAITGADTNGTFIDYSGYSSSKEECHGNDIAEGWCTRYH